MVQIGFDQRNDQGNGQKPFLRFFVLFLNFEVKKCVSQFTPTNICYLVFYLPHMEYEGNIGLETGKIDFFLLIFAF
jgi:hypothetical protein